MPFPTSMCRLSRLYSNISMLLPSSVSPRACLPLPAVVGVRLGPTTTPPALRTLRLSCATFQKYISGSAGCSAENNCLIKIILLPSCFGSLELDCVYNPKDIRANLKMSIFPFVSALSCEDSNVDVDGANGRERDEAPVPLILPTVSQVSHLSLVDQRN